MQGLKPGQRRCVCPTCGEGFNSVFAFDRHRVPLRRDSGRGQRRCLDPAEMRRYGMMENAAGYWITAETMHWRADGKKETPAGGDGG